VQVAGPPAGQEAMSGYPIPLQQVPRRPRRWVVEMILLIVGSLAMALMFAYFAYNAGLNSTIAMTVLALIPLLIVILTVLWIDRWEPEPRTLLLGSFLWGGGVAVWLSMFMNEGVGNALNNVFGAGLNAEGAAAVFGAPFVEEFWKGLGLLVIFLFRRRHFNGPVDGVVYASMIAAGFAFMENVLYFLGNAETVGMVFLLRGIASPFGHLIYTAAIGLALGWASRRSGPAWLVAMPIGYLIAVGLHMAWNGFATIGGESFQNPLVHLLTQFALLNWLPLTIFAVLVIWLRRVEITVLRDRLREYVPSGWFGEYEIAMLTSLPQRRQARQWAQRTGGPKAGAQMKEFQTAATALAYARQDLHSGHSNIRARQDEATLLLRVGASRANFRALTGT